MATPYLGEIKVISWNFAPKGWAFCNGQLMAINQNQALFAILGTTYGGDGQTTFNLPDLRGRIPIHMGSSYVLGQAGGTEAVTLTVSQLPSHAHVPQASSSPGSAASPSGNVWAQSNLSQFTTSAPGSSMDPGASGAAGGSSAHDNMMPFLVISFIISLYGIYPTSS